MAWTIRLGGLPAAGFGDRDVLPVLRSDAADRLVGRGQKVTWPLGLPATGRRERQAGLRTLDRLEGAVWQGRGLGKPRTAVKAAGLGRPLLRVPVLTPKAVVAKLQVATQTGTALLRS